MKTYGLTGKKSKIIFTTDFVGVSILPISLKQFKEYKQHGLPSIRFDTEKWEEFEFELSGEYSGGMIYSDSYLLNLETQDLPAINLNSEVGKFLKISELPTNSIAKEGQNYVIQIKECSAVKNFHEIEGLVDLNKLDISIKPEELPGGQILNYLSIKYEDIFFEQDNTKTDNLKTSQLFLNDDKGDIFKLSSEDWDSNFTT